MAISNDSEDIIKKNKYYKDEITDLFECSTFYEMRIKSLENELTNRNDETKELYSGIKYYEDLKKELELKLSTNEREIKRLIEHNEFYESEIKRLIEGNEFNENEVKRLKKENETYIQKITQFEDKIINEFHNNNQIIKQRILSDSNSIKEILSYKNFNRIIILHAIMGQFKAANLINKMKIIAKILLRCVGVKKHLYSEPYRMDYRIINHLSSIDETTNLLNTTENEIKLTEEKCDIIDKKIIDNKLSKEVIIAKEPYISVLLPVYNHSNFIRTAIEGVQKQTYTNWELIILDDGSTDNLHDILKEYKNDVRIKMYYQENQRLPNGLTNLHNLATGEFVTWTSADNIMEPNMLEELSKELIINPNSVMVFADVSIIDDKGNFLSCGYREMNRDKYQMHIMRLPHNTNALDTENDNFINACFMYRLDAVKALVGQYSADLEGLEDYDFWLRLKAFGEIKHIKNKEPLYRYRVHANTMSEDLIRNKKEEHIKRSNLLINYSQERKKFIEKSWNILIDKKANNYIEFENNLNKIHYNYDANSDKNAVFTDADKLTQKPNTILITLEEENYNIYVNDNNNILKRASIFKGIDISPLATKSRYTKINGLFWEYPAKFVNMPVLGCHMDLNYIDINKTISFINENKNILFVFCELEGSHCKELQIELTKSCDNVLFFGEKVYGSLVYIYASWDMLFVPPMKLKYKEKIISSIVLAWSIGKWIIVEKENSLSEVYPLVSEYYYNEKLLGIKKVNKIEEIEDTLDQYIYKYSTVGTINRLIKFLNGIGQDIMVKRPNFGVVKKNRKNPLPLLFEEKKIIDKSLTNGYIAFMVDSLDKGGLEQVVAFLVRKLTFKGIKVKVLCTDKGGEIANTLANEGYEVIEFNGNNGKFEKYISINKPILINTHFTKNMLDIPKKYKIPIIEVIHNMYVFQDEHSWKQERINEKYFDKFIAVSSLVKEIYIKKHGKIDESKITVVGNAASTSRIHGLNVNYIRNVLNIREDSIVFINISSFDGRKNQLGILTAFDTYYNTVNKNAFLILIGNPLSQFYKNAVNEYVNELNSKEHIILLDYHNDVASLLRASDVFIMSSYYEGWSISATESLYVGTPLIHSKCGSGEELINGGSNGILIDNPAGNIVEINSNDLMKTINTRVPQNTNELINAMKQITNDIIFWRNERANIASHALMKYSENDMVDKYISVFLDVIEKNLVS